MIHEYTIYPIVLPNIRKMEDKGRVRQTPFFFFFKGEFRPTICKVGRYIGSVPRLT